MQVVLDTLLFLLFLSQMHQVMICFPEPLQTLSEMKRNGKLSDREYDQQFLNFCQTLKNALAEHKLLEGSYIFTDDTGWLLLSNLPVAIIIY